jgi:hypothetical protein
MWPGRIASGRPYLAWPLCIQILSPLHTARVAEHETAPFVLLQRSLRAPIFQQLRTSHALVQLEMNSLTFFIAIPNLESKVFWRYEETPLADRVHHGRQLQVD